MSDDPDIPDDANRTVFLAPKAAEGTQPPAPPPAPAAPAPPAASRDDATIFAPAPKATPTGVGPGVVLNNIYEVKRFLARGGMGEVYEGFNVSTDERVAIKVILPALAADPNVRAMFLREAKTLGTLHHPAVVNYRVAADDPQLNVFYIVTEFIDGAPLSDMLAQLDPSPEQLQRLTRRLAEGLGAAHARGVVHRDISPDNVLLPDKLLDHAKIIDFGIAKDTDPSKGTIIGDGFAGKLGYVAPEQFGDYDRAVGPWTDVYSLGLVILALVQKRNVDMGATLVEAVDKRRAGPDLSMVPASLRPVLAAMLTADPAKRLRSMEDVVAALDGIGAAKPGAKAKPPPKPPKPPSPVVDRNAAKAAPPNRMPLIVGGIVGALILIGGLVFVLTSLSKSKAPVAATAQASPRQAIEAALPGVPCSWLDLTDASGGAQGLSVRLRGVAGRPAAVQAAVSGAAGQSGLVLANLNLDEVAPVGDALCTALDTVRTVRAPGGGALSTPQRKFEITTQPDGVVEAKAVINMAPRDPSTDLALIGLEPDGAMTMLVQNRAGLKQSVAAGQITDLGGDSYRLEINTTHSGWSGMLLILGKGPFDPKLLGGGAANRGADWPQKFKAAAAQGGWKTEMVWYRTAKPGEN
jgi:serine/threonine protein kinase